MLPSTSLIAAAALLTLTTLAPAQDTLVIEGAGGPGQGKHIVIVSGDEEYRSEESAPMLAKILSQHHGFDCTVVFSWTDGHIDPKNQHGLRGMSALDTADLMIIGTRFRRPDPEQAAHITRFLDAGKPVIGFRTSTHAFTGEGRFGTGEQAIPFDQFGRRVLGEQWVNHHGEHKRQGTRGVVEKDNRDHPILRGVEAPFGPTDVYGVIHLTEKDTILLRGAVTMALDPDSPAIDGPKNDPMQPLAWLHSYRAPNGTSTGRSFCTTLGASVDFVSADLRRLIVNACYQLTNLDVPESTKVDYVDPFLPSFYGFIDDETWFRDLDLDIDDLRLGLSPHSEDPPGSPRWPHCPVPDSPVRIDPLKPEAAVEPPDSPPNVVFILADDLGFGDLSCLNESAAWKTPHLDRLAAEGMVFTDAHSGSAVCTPTRYGLLTGRYAWRTHLKSGVLGGSSPHLIDPERMTVASLLKKHRYQTCAIGKWHLGWDWPREAESPEHIDFSRPITSGPLTNGFDRFFGHAASLDMPPYVYIEGDRITAPPDRSTENKDYQGFWRKGPTGQDFVHGQVLPRCTREAVEWIRSKAEDSQPFFLYLALPAPHTPILPTEAFRGRSGTNAYGDFVLQVDDTVGQVLLAIDELPHSRQTLFIFASDNGCSPRARLEELAEFGHHPSHVYRGYKADIYEGGHRVPFLVRWPGKVKPGTHSDALVCLTDLLCTLSEIVGDLLPDDAGEDSVSFLPALLDRPEPRRDAVVHHSINGSFAIRSGRWKLAFCAGSGGWSDPRPKAAIEQGLPEQQLYDLETDPGERNNLREKHPEVVDRLTTRMQKIIRDGRSTPGPSRKNEGATPLRRD